MMAMRQATSDLRHSVPRRSASFRLCVKKNSSSPSSLRILRGRHSLLHSPLRTLRGRHSLLHSPLRTLRGRHSLLHSPLRPLRGRNNAFTLFELLAVLTVISIIMALVVGSYGSWGTAHALTGATRIVEAGLNQARTFAITRRAYVAFSYGSAETSQSRIVTGFQSLLWTNDTVSAETLLHATPTSDWEARDGFTPATPLQRLTGHVRLAYVRESDMQAASPPPIYNDMTIFFRPDGSVLSDPADKYAHHIVVYSLERFHRGNNTSEPLWRYLRIDLATGTVTIIKPEVTP